MTGSRTLLARYPVVLRLLLVAALAALVVGLQATLPGGTSADDATLVVNSTGDDPDDDPQDGDCATDNGAYEVAGEVVDECTLRAAIQQANKSGAKTISFDPAVFPPGTPATIVVDPGVTTLSPDDPLPQIEVELTIDASGAGVVLDGEGEIPVGLVVAYDAGKDFSLQGGGDSFAIQNFSESDPVGFSAAIAVCGGNFGTPLDGQDLAVCFDNTLDQITIDGVVISGSSYGVAVMGANVNNLTVTNSDISTPSTCGGAGAAGCLNPGIAGVGVSVFSDDVVSGTLGTLLADLVNDNLWGAAKDLAFVADEKAGDLTDSSINIGAADNGNSITGGISAVLVGFAGNLASEVAVNVSNNSVLTGGTGPGVGLWFCGDAVESEINFAVDDNGAITGDSVVPDSGWPGVYADINSDIKGCSNAVNAAASVSVSGNDSIVSGDENGVEIGARIWNLGSGVNKNTATIQVNDNGEITGVQHGVDVYTRAGGIDGSNNAAIVEVNGNGEITGEGGYGVYVDSDAGYADYNTVSVQVMDNSVITGEGQDGVQVRSDAGSDSIFNSSTVDVSGNGTVTGFKRGVDLRSFAGEDNNNTSTVHVDDNDVITGDSESGVYVSSAAGYGDDNGSTATVNGNGEIGGVVVGPAGAATGAAGAGPQERTGVTIYSTAGGDSDDNTSTVEVIGNESVTGLSYGVSVTGFAGSDGTGSGANGNESAVTISENGVITGDDNDGVYVRSRAGALPCCGTEDATSNTSTVAVGATDSLAGNGDITGGDEGIQVVSEAGTLFGSGDGNTSEVSVDENGHVTGENGNGIEIISRAGTGPSAGGAGPAPIVHGNNNTSTVSVAGTGEHDVTGGDGGIVIRSEAGAEEYNMNLSEGAVELGGGPGGFQQDVSGGSNNTSNVTVTGNRDIAGDEEDGVGIYSAAGALFGEGDNNHATAAVTDNRDIDGGVSGGAGLDGATAGVDPSAWGVDVEVLAGGSTADSADNSTTVTVTGNEDIIGDGGVDVYSTVYGATGNSNAVEISENTGDITGAQGDGISILLCCTVSTVDIVDNEGNISGDYGGIGIFGSASPGIAGFTQNPDALTIATISGNSISNSDGAGINIAGGAFREPAEDGDRSQITGNTIANNSGTGIDIYRAWGILIGPDNVIEDNGSGGGGTGIRIVASESDGNTITQNSIFDNAGLGIDLVDGTAPPDVGCELPEPPPGQQGSVAGFDSPNECLPFPEGMNFVNGKVSGSTAPPDSLVEIFIADNDPDDQEDHGEGKTFVGSAQANGDGYFNLEFPCGMPEGLYTATATDKMGNTSEFGPNVLFPATQACSPTATGTITQTPTITDTPTITPTPTITDTPTITPTPTDTGTATVTPTGTLPTATSTPTVTDTVEAPTATDTVEAPTDTPVTPPTDTPGEPFTPGDVNKDGVVNSVDAAIILQYTADLIHSLAHPLNADADQDGEVNAIDAALILQFEADLIDCLPPDVCGDAGAEAIVAQVRDILALW